jgi:transcriptional regulator with XRE-family HTH domain
MRPQSETTFGRSLAAIRKDRGLSQAELATAAAKTRAAVGHWESGRAFESPAPSKLPPVPSVARQ